MYWVVLYIYINVVEWSYQKKIKNKELEIFQTLYLSKSDVLFNSLHNIHIINENINVIKKCKRNNIGFLNNLLYERDERSES